MLKVADIECTRQMLWMVPFLVSTLVPFSIDIPIRAAAVLQSFGS